MILTCATFSGSKYFDEKLQEQEALFRTKNKLIKEGKLTEEDWNKYYDPIKKEINEKYKRALANLGWVGYARSYCEMF